MKILLISNDINLIEKYINQVDIVNSTILVPSISEQYSYILLDEYNIKIEKENINLLAPYKNKILILGYNKYRNFTTIQKEEFNIESIKQYFDKVEHKPFAISKDDNISKDDMYRLINFMDKLSNLQIPINRTLEELNDCDISFKKIIFSSIPSSTRSRILKEGSILNKIKLLLKVFI